MKTDKELEITGNAWFGDNQPHWTLDELHQHLVAETPEGWLVHDFNVAVVPPRRAKGHPQKENQMTEEGPVKGKPMYRINVVFQELGTPRRYEYDVNDTDLNHLKDVVDMWVGMWHPEEDGDG